MNTANNMKPSDVDTAREAVAQMFSMNKADMTAIEVNLWRSEITRLGAKAMLQFVKFWTSGGGQTSFRQAPRIDDFRRRMDPDFVSIDDALNILRREVGRVGPYSDPGLTDARLTVAVLEMGGWAKVCKDMPDASLDFESKRFAERFKSAWVMGEAAVLQERLPTQRLMGLIAAPKQLAQIALSPYLLSAQTLHESSSNDSSDSFDFPDTSNTSGEAHS